MNNIIAAVVRRERRERGADEDQTNREGTAYVVYILNLPTSPPFHSGGGERGRKDRREKRNAIAHPDRPTGSGTYP
jgi:hypothetical protein